MKVTLKDGQEVEIRKPTARELSDAQKYAGKLFVKLINEKDEAGNPTAIFQSQLETHLERLGIWTKEDNEKLDAIDSEIMQKEREATETRSRSAVRKLALDIRVLRARKLMLISKRNQLNSFTVEDQVNDAKFDYLVSVCVYNTDGTRMFSTVDDYRERAEDDDSSKVALELSKILYGITDDFHSRLIENKILKKIGAVDDKLRLVNEEGQLIDADNRRIDEDGFLINENNQRIDEDGNLLEYNVDDIVYDEE